MVSKCTGSQRLVICQWVEKQKNICLNLFAAFFCVFILLLAACSDGEDKALVENADAASNDMKSIEIDDSGNEVIFIGYTKQLTAKAKTDSGKLITIEPVWESDNNSLAMVNDEGLVTANDETDGVVIITATYAGFSVSIDLIISSALLEEVRISEKDQDTSSSVIDVCQTLQFKAINYFEPDENGYRLVLDNLMTTWDAELAQSDSSSVSTYASVTEDGLFTATQTDGDAEIAINLQATTEPVLGDDKTSEPYTVTIQNTLDSVEIRAQGVQEYTKTIELMEGENVSLQAYGNYDDSQTEITVASDFEVDIDGSTQSTIISLVGATVNALAQGEKDITWSCNDIKGRVTIKVLAAATDATGSVAGN